MSELLSSSWLRMDLKPIYVHCNIGRPKIYLSSTKHEHSILTMRRDAQKKKILRKNCVINWEGIVSNLVFELFHSRVRTSCVGISCSLAGILSGIRRSVGQKRALIRKKV